MKLDHSLITKRFKEIEDLLASELAKDKLDALQKELKDLSNDLYRRQNRDVKGLAQFKRQVKKLKDLAATKVAIEEVDSPSIKRAKDLESAPREAAIVPFVKPAPSESEQKDAAIRFIRTFMERYNAWLIGQVVRNHLPVASFKPVSFNVQVPAPRLSTKLLTAAPTKQPSVTVEDVDSDDEEESVNDTTRNEFSLPMKSVQTHSKSIFDDLFVPFETDMKSQNPVIGAKGGEAQQKEVQEEVNSKSDEKTENKPQVKIQQPKSSIQATPVYVALKAEVERLEAKASQAWGIEGLIWQSNYLAKAEKARAALTAIEAEHDTSKVMDDLIAEKIADPNSDMYQALNTHSSYVCQFTVAPTSWKARALINIEKVIEDNKPTAEKDATPVVTVSA